MQISDFKWTVTDQARDLLGELEIMRRVFALLPQIPQLDLKLSRESLLKSAVYSARIEGIPTDTRAFHNKETQNLLSVYTRIFRAGSQKIKLTVEQIKALHRQAMTGLSAGAGRWRTEPWAVYNPAGVAIFIAPLHTQVPSLMAELVALINATREPAPVVSGVAQFILEKIHPFADGNGRVGRLVSALILHRGGWSFRGLVPVEEYIEAHRENYYRALEPGITATAFIEFWLAGLLDQARQTLAEYTHPVPQTPENDLLPRRKEIYLVIKDHPRCSFDFISRRFSAVNKKTLSYDLSRLVRIGLVKKLGVTRGAVYETQ